MSSFKLDELAREADVPARTVRYYVQRGLLPAPEFRGRDTTYGDDHLQRLLAIKRLQAAHLPLDEIQARLHGATSSELERLVSGSVAVLAGREPPPSPIPPASFPGRHPYRAPLRPDPTYPDAPASDVPELWQRIVLVPGVELLVRDDADPEARRLAREIQATYRHRI